MPEASEIQRQLQQQREWFDVAMACVADAVVIVDADGCVAHLNAVAEQLTGWTLAQARGNPVQQVVRVVDGNTGAPLEHPALQALHSGRDMAPAQGTVLVGREVGETAVEENAVPTRDAQGAISGAVLVMRDVSSRRRVERALLRGEELVRAAFHQAAIGIAVSGRDDRFIDVNQHLCTMLGYSHAELCALTFLDITHPEDRGTTGEQVARLVAGEIPHYAL
jgi:PAS domain S-box-containing protein